MLLARWLGPYYKLSTLSYLMAYYQFNFPDYWKGHRGVTLNGTSPLEIPIFMQSSETQVNKDGTIANENIKIAMQNRQKREDLQMSSAYPSNPYPVNESGMLHSVVWRRGFITYVEVAEEFNFDGKKNVPVKICTSWTDFHRDNSRNHTHAYFEEALMNGHVLNMSWTMRWKKLSQSQTTSINENRFFKVDDYLCFYKNSRAQLFDEDCMLPYMDLIEHYLNKWTWQDITPPLANAFYNKATNNLSEDDSWFRIPASTLLVDALDEPLSLWDILSGKAPNRYFVFDTKPTALGFAANVTFGHNRGTDTIDLNFTVLFDTWTFDFPEAFLNSYRDSSFDYESMELTMYYWIKDLPFKPEREIPRDFWPFIIWASSLLGIICTLAIMVVLVRSRSVLNMDIWRLWESKKMAAKAQKASNGHPPPN